MLDSSFSFDLGTDAFDKRPEVWKRIKGFPNYRVSSHGRIKSLARVTQSSRDGIPYNRHIRETILRGRADKDGYRVVTLGDGQGGYQLRVHQIVANAFCGRKPKNATLVRHRDDDQTNNCYWNLQWGTQKDNVADKVSRDRQAKGSRVAGSVLTTKDVHKIAKLLTAGHTQRSIADQFGVTQANINCISRGKTWSHTTGFQHA